MAEGYDGFVAFKGKPYLVDEETGVIMSSIIRKFLLGLSLSFVQCSVEELLELIFHFFHGVACVCVGSQYIHRMRRLIHLKSAPGNHLDASTSEAISRARAQDPSPSPSGTSTPTAASHSPTMQTRNRWVEVATHALQARVQAHSRRNIGDALRVGGREHMSGVDSFDGDGARRGGDESQSEGETTGDNGEEGKEKDLITVKPVVDGRMLDVARKGKKARE